MRGQRARAWPGELLGRGFPRGWGACRERRVEVGSEVGFVAAREDGVDEDIVFVVFLAEEFALFVDDAHEAEGGLGETEFEAHGAVQHDVAETLLEDVDAFAGFEGDADGLVEVLGDGAALFRGAEVDFVEDDEHAFLVGVEFLEDLHGGFVELEDPFLAGVEDVDEEVGDDGFFERGFEGLDEPVGEIADEADGICQEELLAVGELDLAGGGVERGEELVFGEDLSAGDEIEERGFSGVGVADDGSLGDGDALALLALGETLLFDLFELAFDGIDAPAGETAVGFELALAFAAIGTAAAAAAAGLAVEVAPHAGEPREGVLLAGEIDLEPCFCGAGAHGEDVEDDFFAVDDGEVAFFFPCALLGWAEAVVEDDDIALEFFGACDEFLDLA